MNNRKERIINFAFFDIDGVLADCHHRLHYLDDKDYGSFYSYEEVMKDEPIPEGMLLLETFKNQGYKIIFVTSRADKAREATLDWLQKYGLYDIVDDGLSLFMRPSGDHRHSYEVKVDTMGEVLSMFHGYKGTRFFIDDYHKNCMAIKKNFPEIQPIVFGVNRIIEEGNQEQ